MVARFGPENICRPLGPGRCFNSECPCSLAKAWSRHTGRGLHGRREGIACVMRLIKVQLNTAINCEHGVSFYHSIPFFPHSLSLSLSPTLYLSLPFSSCFSIACTFNALNRGRLPRWLTIPTSQNRQPFVAHTESLNGPSLCKPQSAVSVVEPDETSAGGTAGTNLN